MHRLLCLLAAALLVSPLCAQPDTAAVHAERVAWLKANVTPIRTLDPADDDMSDLMPLKAAIGDARIVMLGEQSHADGATFLAKARLIRFLHREMGFNVLAWESGLYDVHRAWERIEEGADPIEAIEQAVFSVWTASEQVYPVLAYVADAAKTERPLEVAGFDMQATGRFSREELVPDLEAFFAGVAPELLQGAAWQAFRAPYDYIRQGTGPELRTMPEDARQRFYAAVDTLQRIAAGTPAPEAAFWAQVLESSGTLMHFLWNMDMQNPRPDVFNLRDAQMADNLLWLAQHRYPDRKIIVWGATSHVTRNRDRIQTEAAPKMIPMGDLVYEALGDAVYTIGFTAYDGEIGYPREGERGRPRPIGPAPAGSLDALLHATGHDAAFLDLRDIRPGGAWLHEPLVSRPMGYAPMRAPWPEVMDGVLFVDVMTPSTMRPPHTAR